MKKSLILALLVLGVFQAVAIPPRHVAFPVTQSDGTTIMVYKYGDGRLAFYATTDGLTLQKNDSGDLCYARLEYGHAVPTDVVAHEAALRTADEADFIQRNVLRVEDAMNRGIAERRLSPTAKAISASTSDGLGQYGKSGMGAVNSIGNYTIPVLMVQFKDSKFKSTTTVAKMTRFYNTEGYHEETGCVGSVRDYFKSQSNGMFVPTFEIVGTVTLPENTVYYGGNVTDRTSEWYGCDKGLCADNYFVVDAVELAVEQGIDFSKYEVNGKVPLISILYAGRGEATESNGENYIWPCEWDINQEIAGTHFNSYFVGNELYYDGSLMGMGVFAHEFGHALGLPDFYCTDYSYSTSPIGEWSVMDGGAYVNEARAPMGYTAYERSYLGWLNIPELTEAEEVTLDSYDDEGGTPARMFRNPANKNEYFIFENHQPGTWYPKSYGSGMLVMRICYSQSAWEKNTLNNTKSKQRVKLITANGSEPATSGSKSSELYSYNGASRDVTTWPLYNGQNLASRPLYKIKKSNGKITFNFLEKEINTHAIGDTIIQDGIYYVLTTNTDVILVGSPTNRYTGRLNIPESIKEGNHTYTVVGVASETFANSPELEGVSLPKSITSIEEGAFFNTPKLDSIEVRMPNSRYRIIEGALACRYTAEDGTSGVRPTTKADDENVVTFDFAANSWGHAVSTSSAVNAGEVKEPIEEGGITMTSTNGSTITRFWKSGATTDLRVYSGGSSTFTSQSNNPIVSVVATATKWNMTANTGELSEKTWTGEAESVTFTATNTNNIQQITITTAGDAGQKTWAILYYPTARQADLHTIAGNVIKVENGAYEDAQLENIHILDGGMQLTLDEDALSTPHLKSLVVDYPTPPTCLANPFAKINTEACKLIIPEGAYDLYSAAEFWKDFIIETSILPTTLTPEANNSIFDLQGRRVNGQLPKGIYIVGGKKLIR